MIQKIKILNSEYWPELDTIVWDVQFVKDPAKKLPRARIKDKPKSDKPNIKQLAFRASNFKEVRGIVGDVTTEDWNNFCELMKGKIVNWDSEAQNQIMDVDKLKAYRKDIKDKMKEATGKDGVDENSLKEFGAQETQELSEAWHNYPFYEAEVIEKSRAESKQKKEE